MLFSLVLVKSMVKVRMDIDLGVILNIREMEFLLF